MIADTLTKGRYYELGENTLHKDGEFEAVKKWCDKHNYTIIYGTKWGSGQYWYYLVPPGSSLPVGIDTTKN